MRIRRSAYFLAAVLVTTGSVCWAQDQGPSSAEIARFFRSVQLDDAGTVRKMLATTVNPNQVNPVRGEPGLVLAVREKAMKVVDVLLAQPGINLEAQAVNGNTALMMAAYGHNAPAVTMLLDHGAAVNRTGWTALHYAAAAGDDGIVRQLVAHHADLNAVSPVASGRYTPLMMAAREGHDRTVQLLLGAGADTSLRNSEGKTVVEIAEQADKRSIAAAIREYEGAPAPAASGR